MKHGILGSIGLISLAALGASPAEARYPLTGTLPKEQNIILSCTVSDALTAKDCSPQPGTVASQRTQAFIQVETGAPDYLIGATPGARVLVMIRRSTAAPLDNTNPGRALPPPTLALPPVVAPDWGTMPNRSDLEGYFPERAARTGVSGNATVRCTVSPSGDLLGCWVASENPSDMGFGRSTLKLSTFVQMKPAAKDGSPTVGRAYALQAAFDVDVQARTAKITLSSTP
jgi:TonB family protein